MSPKNSILHQYLDHQKRQTYRSSIIVVVLIITVILGIRLGTFEYSFTTILRSIFDDGSSTTSIVIWNLRLPRIIAAILAGWGLGLSGLAMQTLLQNPLASPSTMGISQGAAFGAAFAIVILGAVNNPLTPETSQTWLNFMDSAYVIPLFAFIGSMTATIIVFTLSTLKRLSSESMILVGVALSSFFSAATILIQYLSTEDELSAAIFWTFGDVTRSSWTELGVLAVAFPFITAYYIVQALNLNTFELGEENAKSLGTAVYRIKIMGIILASLVAALVTAFHGIIGFLGLLAPHLARRFISNNHRFLILGSGFIGSTLLLMADTCGRLLINGEVLPVGILTSFMGVPMFLYLLLKGSRHDAVR